MKVVYKSFMLNLFVLAILYSCNNTSNRQVAKNSVISPKKDSSVLAIMDTNSLFNEQVKILTKGDTACYEDVQGYYFDRLISAEYLYYALVMSDKYHYPKAYYDVYRCFFYQYNDSFKVCPEFRAQGIRYLKKAAELKVPVALEELGEMYIKGKYVKKNIEKGKRLIKESKKIEQ